MTYMVPFDGSDLSEAALRKARVHAVALDEAPPDLSKAILGEKPLEVVAVSIVPDSARYARKKGWIEEGEEFRTRTVVERLHRRVTDIDPSASFRFERVGGDARAGTISSELRQKAEDLDAFAVVLGSENAGRIVSPITSVGDSVAADREYDVCIVRHELPEDVRARLKSDFHIPG